MSQVWTRSSTHGTSTIGENFLAINCPPTPAAGTSSNAIHCSLSNTSDLVHVNRPMDNKVSNQGENFLPADCGNPDPDPDRDPDQEPDEPAPHPDNFLVCSLELLANKIVSIPEAPKPKSTIKPCSPNVFDGSDPTILDVFTFQCSMYMAARPTDFPNQQSQVAFSLSFLKGVPLDWFQGELTWTMASSGDFLKWFVSYPMQGGSGIGKNRPRVNFFW